LPPQTLNRGYGPGARYRSSHHLEKFLSVRGPAQHYCTVTCNQNLENVVSICLNIPQIKIILTIFGTTLNPSQHEVCRTSKAQKLF